MDNFVKHLAPLNRRYPTRLPVQSVGYIARKHETVKRAFETFNYSLILSGEGFYFFRGEMVAVKGPCMITQWPGEMMHYGPTSGCTWEEFYIIYEAKTLAECEHRNLIQKHQPFWPIRRGIGVMEQFSEIRKLLSVEMDVGYVDRIDRACEHLLMEARLAENLGPAGHDEQVIHRIRQVLRDRLCEHLDLEVLAREHGLSLSTFRRYWSRYVHQPPGHYVTGLRIREARRLLAETRLPVAEIGRKTGFEDPFYFSRCFRQMTGFPPTRYREQFLSGL